MALFRCQCFWEWLRQWRCLSAGRFLLFVFYFSPKDPAWLVHQGAMSWGSKNRLFNLLHSTAQDSCHVTSNQSHGPPLKKTKQTRPLLYGTQSLITVSMQDKRVSKVLPPPMDTIQIRFRLFKFRLLSKAHDTLSCCSTNEESSDSNNSVADPSLRANFKEFIPREDRGQVTVLHSQDGG